MQPLPPDRPPSLLAGVTQPPAGAAPLNTGEANERPLRLVAVDHPAPPSRPTAAVASAATTGSVARSRGGAAPSEQDRLGLRALFTASATPAVARDAAVRTASAKVVTNTQDTAPAGVAFPGQVVARFETSPTRTIARPGLGRFSGPAVAPINLSGFLVSQ